MAGSDASERRSLAFSWPTILLLLGIATGGLLRRPALEPIAHPPAGDYSRPAPAGAQTIEARLWQDPIEAVYHAKKDTPPSDLRELADEIARSDAPEEIRSVLCLAVTIPGGGEPESRELRLRTRYAVIAALGLAGYGPTCGGRLGYYESTCSASKAENAGHTRSPLPREGIAGPIAFERFERADRMPRSPSATLRFGTVSADAKGRTSGGDFGSVLVLWVDDVRLGERPFAGLMGCLDPLLAALPKAPHLAWIGPSSSDGLLALDRELQQGAPASTARVQHPEIFSPWATLSRGPHDDDAVPPQPASVHPAPGKPAPLSKRIQNIPNPMVQRATFREETPSEKPRILSVIGSDDALIAKLIDEMCLRGACVRDPRNHVILAAELDSTYGRALADDFRRVRDRDLVPENVKTTCTDDWPKNAPENIGFCSYLRGLDGVPESAPPKSRDSKETKSEAGTERAEGASQLDYVRRIEGALAQLCRGIERKNPGASVRAIGVLGSDVTDKLLLLKALRPTFPRAIFFTTDLDARLEDPRERDATQNLLIASHFGLTLRPEVQSFVPPFRDCYQSSTYLACLDALDARFDEDSAPRSTRQLLAAPRVYEIGRNGAYDLSGAVPIPMDANPPNRRADYSPRPSAALLLLTLLAIPVIGAALSGSLGRALCATARARFRNLGWKRSAIFVTALVLLAAFSVAAWIDHHSGHGEPFVLFDGISVWPTEILRLVACAVAAFGLWLGRRGFTQNLRRVTQRYFPDLPPTWDEKETWRQRMAATFELPWERPRAALPTTPLWSQYLLATKPRACFERVAALVVLFLAVTSPLFFVLQFPINPTRGTLSAVTNQLVLWTSVGFFVVLTFAVVDATRVFGRFVHTMRDRDLELLGSESLTIFGRTWTEPSVRGDLIKFGVVADHSRLLVLLVYAPSVVLLLQLVARSSFFDRWDWPLSLVLVYAVNGFLVLWTSVYLRRRAMALRGRILESLDDRKRGAQADDPNDPAVEARIREIDAARNVVETTRVGAFSRLGDDPVVKAALIPFGGLGALPLLDAFSSFT